jgi:hypothetical protein
MESINQVFTILGFFIAWLTLTGTARDIVGLATVLALAIWLITIPLRKRGKMMNSVKNIKNILMRIVAVFAANGLAVIGAGAIAGISTAKAITVAGLTAVAAVVESLLVHLWMMESLQQMK